MTHNMLQNNEEMMQRQMVAVEHPAITKRLLNQLFHDQFRDVHEIAAFYDYWVSSYKR